LDFLEGVSRGLLHWDLHDCRGAAMMRPFGKVFGPECSVNLDLLRAICVPPFLHHVIGHPGQNGLWKRAGLTRRARLAHEIALDRRFPLIKAKPVAFTDDTVLGYSRKVISDLAG